MVAGDVGDHRDVVAVVAQALADDAAAGHLEDGHVDGRVLEDHLGRLRPRHVALLVRRPSMTMPSVEVIPTRRPISLKTWAIIRTVVVLPFVPVTATIGIRAGAPGGKRRSRTGFATYCGSPSVGWVCIRNPGAALTSTIPPPVSRTGSVMSGQMKSIPAMSRPTTRAAVSAISTLSGWASMVRSIEVPPVDMLPVRASLTQVARRGHVVEAEALLGHDRLAPRRRA